MPRSAAPPSPSTPSAKPTRTPRDLIELLVDATDWPIDRRGHTTDTGTSALADTSRLTHRQHANHDLPAKMRPDQDHQLHRAPPRALRRCPRQRQLPPIAAPRRHQPPSRQTHHRLHAAVTEAPSPASLAPGVPRDYYRRIREARGCSTGGSARCRKKSALRCSATGCAAAAEFSTPATERGYLRWLLDEGSSPDAAGID